MAGQGAGSGPVGEVLLAFERAAVAAEASRVRGAGSEVAEDAADLVAALEEASAAAAGAQTVVPGGLLTGPALAECAALLARRARATRSETDDIADAMTRAAGLLAEADEEVAHRVAGAGG